MKCRKQFRFHKLPISNLWEVHLDEDIWLRIKRVSKMRNCTYSWICRYCAFRIARKKKLFIHPAMEILSNKVKMVYKNKHLLTHRHLLCLYGEDEKLLRITAMQLEISVSHLIRLSLYWILPKLEKETFDNRFLYYYGTRICRFLHLTRSSQLKLPYFEHFFYAKWPIESWWKRPFPFLYIPFTPGENIHKIYEIINDPPPVSYIAKYFLTR